MDSTEILFEERTEEEREKFEAKLLDSHLHGCVVEGFEAGEGERVVGELVELYTLANR